MKRDEHMKKCKACFVTFSHLVFGGGQDYAYIVVILQALEDVFQNAIWDLDNGNGFRALDLFGVKGTNASERFDWGPCIYLRTGHNKIQGRVAAKVYSLLHCILKTNSNKDTVDRIAVDVRGVDTDKFKFFNEALKTYFCKVFYSHRSSNELISF